MPQASVKKSDIARFLDSSSRGEDCSVSRIASIEEAGEDAAVFAADESSVTRALQSGAGVILSREGDDERIVLVKDPRLAFARVWAKWFDHAESATIHPTATIESGAELGEDCSVGVHAVLFSGARLGNGCTIGAHVVIHSGTTLGKRVKVQSGAVLGSDGFGYARGPEGYIGFPQIGSLWIGDDVEIGANSTIDRGALGETRIGRGTKIDNLVHIGHNCQIGKDVVIAAQVGIAGSTIVGDGAILAGQVGLAEHVTIGPGVIVGAQGGVPTSKKLTGPGEVFWGTPARPIRDYLKDLARLRRR